MPDIPEKPSPKARNFYEVHEWWELQDAKTLAMVKRLRGPEGGREVHRMARASGGKYVACGLSDGLARRMGLKVSKR